MEDEFDDFEMEVTSQKEESPKREVYFSQPGFVRHPVYRGFTEVDRLFHDVKSMGGFICGGYVRYMCSPKTEPCKAGDVDVYCPTDEVFNELKIVFSNHMKVKAETEVALTYHRVKDGIYFPSPAVQLIKPIREGKIVANGTMEEILDNFDFTVIRCGLITPVLALVDADFVHDETRSELRLKNIHCPISSTLRCMKYAVKGYWTPPMHVLQLFLDWNERDDDYKLKLIDFLDKANEGQGLTQEQVNDLEAMMRID